MTVVRNLRLGWVVLLLSAGCRDNSPASSPTFPAVQATPPALENSAPTFKRIVFLGNSLSAGYGLEESQAFPALLQQKINASEGGYQVVNAGVSGDTSAGGLSRIDWLLRQPLEVLFLELGANDGLRGVDLAVIRRNLQAIIDKTLDRYPQARIVIAGMRMPPNMGRRYTEGFHLIFSDLAKRNGAVLIPFLLEEVGGRPELNQPDGIHPTAQGHQLIAAHVWLFLEPLLKR